MFHEDSPESDSPAYTPKSFKLRQLRQNPGWSKFFDIAQDLVLGYILLTFGFPSRDKVVEYAGECFNEAKVHYAKRHPDLPLSHTLRKHFHLPTCSTSLMFTHSLGTPPVIRPSGERVLYLSHLLRNLTSQQLADQVTCHRGKLRDYARTVVDTYRDLAVKHTPPDILRNDRGRTLAVPEEEDEIISRFVQEMLTNFSFLNNHMVQPNEVSAVVFYIDINPT